MLLHSIYVHVIFLFNSLNMDLRNAGINSRKTNCKKLRKITFGI